MGGLLIVDDENILRNGLRVMIEDFHLALSPILEAENGLRALEIIARQRPRIILLDIVMPHMDGIELLKEMKERGLDCNVIVLSGHGEFEYAKEAIRYRVFEYLLKPVKRDELERALKNLLASVESAEEHEKNATDFGLDILSGVGLNRISFSEFLNKNRIIMPYPFFYAAYVQVSGVSSEDAERIAADLIQALRQEFSCILPIPDKCERFMVILNTQKPMDSSEQVLRDILRNDSSERCEITVGLSGVRDCADDVPQLFKEAKIAFMERILSGSGNLYYYAKLYSKDNKININELEITKIVTMLEVGDYQALADFLGEKYHAENLSKGVTIKNVQDSYCNILLQVASHYVGVTKAADFMTVKIHEFFDQMLECTNLFGANDKLLAALINIGDKTEYNEESYSRKKIIFLAKKFILNNYHKNINLDMIANHVSMNPAYFSVLFKKVEGISLIDFIVNIRINKAKGYLAYPGNKIYEVAEMAGFQDVKYFSKVFKKKVGITPMEYREKCIVTSSD